ncbi:MAG: molybdopterin-binding protein [Bacteroidota bacterium]|nr:molybdopterin-binding protein [Bacteroidota bacterium]
MSVNISSEKGTIKTPVSSITLTPLGIDGDAHAGKWHRQVSMLGVESLEKFEQQTGQKMTCGEFAENITTSGMNLYETNPLDRFIIGRAELEITQIGKDCHGSNCAIFKEVGDCIMPKEGIFCRVIQNGSVKAGDEIVFHPRVITAKVITMSDRASAGIYTDRSGPLVIEMLEKYFSSISYPVKIEHSIIGDDKDYLHNLLLKCRDQKVDVVITTGGTGISPRDITPDTVKTLLDKEIPGIMESIRVKFGQQKYAALLSRSIAGVMGHSLVFTLPGSVQAVGEYLGEITRGLKHMIYMINQIDTHQS